MKLLRAQRLKLRDDQAAVMMAETSNVRRISPAREIRSRASRLETHQIKSPHHGAACHHRAEASETGERLLIARRRSRPRHRPFAAHKHHQRQPRHPERGELAWRPTGGLLLLWAVYRAADITRRARRVIIEAASVGPVAIS